MLPIFKNFRRKLLTDSKFSKYLVYGIGEIILVVIGILIALSINNWNAERSNREFEMKMLEEIQKALKEDYIFFSDHLINHRTKTELHAVDFFDRSIISNSVVKDSVDYHFVRLDYGLQMTVNRGPYDALKYSGIDKISNAEIRNKLIYFYDFHIPRYELLATYKRESSRNKIIPLMDELGEYSTLNIVEGSIERNGLKLAITDFSTNEKFNQLLYLTKERALFIKDILDDTLPILLELIGMLEQEIEKMR